MNRIDQKFIQLKKQGKKALIAFITAGYPDLATTARLVKEFEKKGVDIIELGVPFSDPLADGPMIQEATLAALKKGANLNRIFALVKKLRQSVDLPICLMTYYNPVFRYGNARFIRQAKLCGVDGVIIPDLPCEEAKEFTLDARKKDLANICFIAPTTTCARIKTITRSAQGFIYYVALTGVTGSRKSLSADLRSNLLKIKKITAKPVCAGFGIASAKQVRTVNKVCDGAIVGSAIVRKIKENIGRPDLVRRVANFVESLNV